ncbi:MAG: hypothetical protein WAN30_04275 [Acidimicrobiales bacterium]
MEIIYQSDFGLWWQKLVKRNIDVAGELQALFDVLGTKGRSLGDPESHPVVTSKLGLRALRRTPPTDVTPYADGPPIIRVLYGFIDKGSGQIAAVLLLGGDKTALRNEWYPLNVAEAERRLTILAGKQNWRIVMN